MTGFIDQIACFKIIGRIEHQINIRDQRIRCGTVEIGDHCLDLNFRVGLLQMSAGSFRFRERFSSISFCVDDLPLQIR